MINGDFSLEYLKKSRYIAHSITKQYIEDKELIESLNYSLYKKLSIWSCFRVWAITDRKHIRKVGNTRLPKR